MSVAVIEATEETAERSLIGQQAVKGESCMKGHLRKRGNAWSIVIDLGRDTSGKRRQKWHSVKGSKRDAEAMRAKLVTEVNSGGFVHAPKFRLGQHLDEWLATYVKQNVSPKTFERYQQIIERNIKPLIGGIELRKLTPMMIQS